MAKPSERNRQIIRQWEILKTLEVRPSTLAELVASVGDRKVTDRTIRRDLQALETAGFPLFDETNEDGAKLWRLARKGIVPRRAA